jgi:hypothetical protein
VILLLTIATVVCGLAGLVGLHIAATIGADSVYSVSVQSYKERTKIFWVLLTYGAVSMLMIGEAAFARLLVLMK